VPSGGGALNGRFDTVATSRLWHATNACCWHSTHGSP